MKPAEIEAAPELSLTEIRATRHWFGATLSDDGAIRVAYEVRLGSRNFPAARF